jgi:hypothetical protein
VTDTFLKKYHIETKIFQSSVERCWNRGNSRLRHKIGMLFFCLKSGQSKRLETNNLAGDVAARCASLKKVALT